MPDDLPLGRETDYPETYDPDLLRSIPRADARRDAGIQEPPPFDGDDIWNAYEVSWLDTTGKPTAYVGELSFPATSTNIVESKSLKLYLNSLSHERHACADNVAEVIRRDLVPVALERFRLRAGRALAPGEAVIVGDTPEDIDCARAHGCPVLGVATGPFSAEQLRRAGADEVREDLTDTDGIMAWLEAATFRLRP